MLGAPHHNATLVEGVAGPSHLVGAKGPLAWVSGDVWKLREALPKIGLGTAAFTDGTVAADDVAAIAAQCARDVVLAAPTTSAGYGAYGARPRVRLSRFAVPRSLQLAAAGDRPSVYPARGRGVAATVPRTIQLGAARLRLARDPAPLSQARSTSRARSSGASRA